MLSFARVMLGVALLFSGLSAIFLPQPVFAATSLDIFPFYRQDNLVWNKAGLDNFPNIISELKWQNLRIQGFKGVLTHDLGRRHYLEASGSWGWIYSGSNQDSDYDGNNRTLEFSRTIGDAGGGTVFDASLAIGWKLQDTPTTHTSLLLGYAINRQTLTLTDCYQTINGRIEPDGNVNTAYMALWRGPWLGLALEESMSPRLRLLSRLEFHLPDYNGETHWNRRTDLAHPVTNNHWAKGQGIVASLGIDYQAGPRWRLGAGIDYTNYWIRPGTDQVNGVGGSHPQIQLNEVRWDSWAFRLKASYVF